MYVTYVYCIHIYQHFINCFNKINNILHTRFQDISHCHKTNMYIFVEKLSKTNK